MTRITLLTSLSLVCAACSGAAITPAGRTSQATVNQAPEYATDAERARAQYYWLPRNQLPPDAGVESPTPRGAAAQGDD
jgi:hypothetical protein